MAIDLRREFGTSVKTYRHLRGISQEELAGRAGLHRTYISDIERGARNLSLESIAKLAEALGVSVASLFRCDDPSSQPTDIIDILLVEDNPDDVQLTARALKKAKITNRIHLARDGAEALDYLFSTGRHAGRAASEKPQLILLDLELPKISGQEVLRRIKEDSRTRAIPVVVLTVSNADRERLLTKQLGADAYVVKPIEPHSLVELAPALSLQWALLKAAG